MRSQSNHQCTTLLHLYPLPIATTRVERQSQPYSPAASFPSWGVASCLHVPSVVHDKKLGIVVFTPPSPFHHAPRYPLKTTFSQNPSTLQKHHALRIVYASAKPRPLKRLKDLHLGNLHPPPGYLCAFQKTWRSVHLLLSIYGSRPPFFVITEVSR